MLKFILKTYAKKSIFWILGLLSILSFFKIGFSYFGYKLDDRWTQIFDPTLTVFGFVVPLILGWFLLDREWKSSLGNKITVHFKLKDHYVLSCFEAYLASEADIRAWGQTIGQQMNNGNFLSFYPYLSQEGPFLKFDSEKKVHYQLYILTIYLKFDSEGEYLPLAPGKIEFDTKKYKIWFDNNNDSPGNEELIIEAPKEIISLEKAKQEFEKKENEKNLPA